MAATSKKAKGLYCYQGEAFQENKDYQLEASQPQYPSISAQTTVPVVPKFWFGTFANTNEKTQRTPYAHAQVLLELDDDEKTNNYYMVTSSSTYELKFRVGFPEERDSIVTYTEPNQLNSQSPIIEITHDRSTYEFVQLKYDWETIYFVSETSLIFSDKVFNGQKASIPIDLSMYGYNKTTHIHLTLTSISEEYYQLLRSLATLIKTENSLFPDALQVYSNIHSGHGIWGAKSSKTVSLDITGNNLFNNK